jgi:hypothetical protein
MFATKIANDEVANDESSPPVASIV